MREVDLTIRFMVDGAYDVVLNRVTAIVVFVREIQPDADVSRLTLSDGVRERAVPLAAVREE